MIHAYLFVTRNYFDRDDHGDEFKKHMRRINEKGMAITHIQITYSTLPNHNLPHISRWGGVL